MKAKPKPVILFAGLLVLMCGCATKREGANLTRDQGASGSGPSSTLPAFAVQISEEGVAVDAKGQVVTREVIKALLEAGSIRLDSPIMIMVKGSQKVGVLEAVKSFDDLGFTSVKIVLVISDPLTEQRGKQRPNQSSQHNASSGHGGCFAPTMPATRVAG